MVDRTNHHLFQPLLYQLATGILSSGEIAPPIRDVLRKQRNTRVLLGEVVGIDADRRSLAVHTLGTPVGDRLRQPDRCDRGGAVLLRPRRVRGRCTRPEDDRRCARDPCPHLRRVRACRAGARSGAARALDDVRRDRSRPDRRGDGGTDRRALAPRARAKLPLDRPPGRPRPAARWRQATARLLPRVAAAPDDEGPRATRGRDPSRDQSDRCRRERCRHQQRGAGAETDPGGHQDLGRRRAGFVARSHPRPGHRGRGGPRRTRSGARRLHRAGASRDLRGRRPDGAEPPAGGG